MSGVYIAGLVVSGIATIGFFGVNHKFRAEVDRAVAPMIVPERQWRGYSAQDLNEFRIVAVEQSTAFGKSALDLYRDNVLRLDMGFAVALGLFSLLAWVVATQQIGSSIVSSAAMFGGIAGAIYGISDLGEDIILRMLLRPERTIRDDDARTATALTWLKLATICISMVGAIVFALLSIVFGAMRSSAKS
ncbi:hypothetical protein HZZ13_00765 [Bradyrhizobium sp. CNPSo 4010]|uniref:Uncharacterized protein n=1 Tax=Bradyrhizobium agreste TaxID=2751811 RepID=A0ABS0PGN2_9BRAD|nr:hypothetical protein [Bradyrhizobium agreste]MBH5396352.1 hypothetical protein [Bradyrhizobium agreste]